MLPRTMSWDDGEVCRIFLGLQEKCQMIVLLCLISPSRRIFGSRLFGLHLGYMGLVTRITVNCC
jgi:hypothetical protein